jgi:hypothetical protein
MKRQKLKKKKMLIQQMKADEKIKLDEEKNKELNL